MTPDHDSSVCSKCARLVALRKTVRDRYPDYFASPVPSFGDPTAAFLVVGLAPGMHGANRTGRPFTGDYAGILLYEALYQSGFSNQAKADEPDDGLQLLNCRITNAVRCLPPENKPEPSEVRACNAFLSLELSSSPTPSVILALGRVAHQAVLMALGLPATRFPFAHGALHELPDGRTLVSSYHCSRYNTQTRRLTREMFLNVMQKARSCLQI